MAFVTVLEEGKATLSAPEKDPQRENLEGLVAEYHLSKDRAIRNKIVLACDRLLRYVTVSTRGIYQKYCGPEDIANEAVIALMAAIEGFDPGKGVKFQTYATIKMRGAVIDYVRKQDIIPRSVRRFSREMDQVFLTLYSRLNREPTSGEMAEAMNMPMEKFQRLMAASVSANCLSFEEMLGDWNEDASDMEPADSSSEVEDHLLIKERSGILAKGIEGLKEQQRLVVTLYYYEQLKFSDIAKVLGVSESRVSQIHTKALLNLKRIMSL